MIAPVHSGKKNRASRVMTILSSNGDLKGTREASGQNRTDKLALKYAQRISLTYEPYNVR